MNYAERAIFSGFLMMIIILIFGITVWRTPVETPIKLFSKRGMLLLACVVAEALLFFWARD